MLSVRVHTDNPDVCSDPTAVAAGTTRALARKEKANSLVEERVREKATRPIETHGDVDNQIKKARIEGMKSHVNKIDIEAIIVQVQIMRANEEILIGSLGKTQYNEQIVHLLGQLPGLNKSKSNNVLETPDGGGKLGNIGTLGSVFQGNRGNDYDESSESD